MVFGVPGHVCQDTDARLDAHGIEITDVWLRTWSTQDVPIVSTHGVS